MTTSESERPRGEAVDPTPDERARAAEQQMTDDERFSLVVSVAGAGQHGRDPRWPDDVPLTAGYTPGVPRLGVPALLSRDASMGVTNPGFRPDDGATAMPASLAVAASFDPGLARRGGAAIAREARSRGINVLLAGGMNLARDPRNGRNFEYYGEDPLLAGALAAEAVNGIQGEGVISTLKHFSLNCNETNRHWLDAVIEPAAHRESDLLAFQIAVERSPPGSIMGAYNKVNGEYAGGSPALLLDVLKGAWGYPGWVMSDWGATPRWEFALHGLDQESGPQIDALLWQAEPFTGPLRAAHVDGRLPRERLSDMVRRILRSVYAVGVDRWGPAPEVDLAAHDAIALDIARQGIVLLKNDGGALPIPTDRPLTVGVIGGYAHLGVPTGTGSGAVRPVGGYADVVPIGGGGVMGGGRNLFLLPSSPLRELRRLLPRARVEFDPGLSPAEAALLARRCDVVVAFGIRVEGEGFDIADLPLPWDQDAVIDAVATANPHTIVVLETGNPVAMPWQDRVRAVVQAWYPGQAGGRAIAEVLTGAVNPSGRLPITFPAGLAQTPRPELANLGDPWGTPATIEYHEGAEAGYRWWAHRGERPMYAFGHGLGHTTFSHGELAVVGGATITATVTVTNTGARAGTDVPQLYLTAAAGDRRRRLLAFARVDLEPGESRRVTMTADPRLLAGFDGAAGRWRIAGGSYGVAVGRSDDDLVLEADAPLDESSFGP